MFSSITAIRNASREANSTASHWFDASSMRFFNTTLFEKVFPIGQRGAIFVTSEYQDEPKYTAYSLRYASRNHEGHFTITTLDDFMGYDSLEEANDAAEAYQTFYLTVMGA
jgi:hypothetical protein